MSFAIVWCWHHMTPTQYDAMCVIDERNHLTSCPLVDHVRALAPAGKHPLLSSARDYRDDPAWFRVPEGQHVAEVHKRGIPRVVFHGEWFELHRRVVVGEFEAR